MPADITAHEHNWNGRRQAKGDPWTNRVGGGQEHTVWVEVYCTCGQHMGQQDHQTETR